MRQKDYYRILGVSPNESPEGIRSAFRRLAKKYHPDKAGPEAKDRFQDVQEAYEVLSDPEKRSSYDRQITSQRRRHRQSAPIYDTTFGARSVFHDFFQQDPFFGRSASRPFQAHRTVRPHPDLVLTLTAQEARMGGTVKLEIPYYRTCPHCGGSGEYWFFPCSACMGNGLLRGRKRVTINIPSGIEDGSMLEIPIQGSGLLRRFLTVLIQVH